MHDILGVGMFAALLGLSQELRAVLLDTAASAA
jgi:hypothetical protein